ncbi:MAG: radical SAM family heme chaperone HemW, partial [Desulfobacula sp.]|nr:radical SAM family heme chaperone HemW [Desulfobacula sp.]
SKTGAIYIHIPFCIQKCIYCDFYSKTNLAFIPDYIKTLVKEIKKRSELQTRINTIYFGGGTPSLLTTGQVDLLLHTIKDNFSIAPNAEISFEINPGTIDLKYLEDLRNIGINRLSIGIQSFNDDKLKFLGRIHSADEAVKAVNHAQKAKFSNISFDLIYGLFFETKSMWLKDLEKAVNMKPSHLSCYMLTIEPLTALYKKVKAGNIIALDNASMTWLFKKTAQVLSEFQFEHYEISSFAKGRAYRSKHNSQYWDMTPYFGFGAAAHSYDGKKRAWNHKSIKKYIKDINLGRLPVEDFEILDVKQKKLETIMLRLRTLEGIDVKKYNSQFNISFKEEFKDIIKKVQDNSCGYLSHDSFTLNLEGRTRLDNIIETFAKKIL